MLAKNVSNQPRFMVRCRISLIKNNMKFVPDNELQIPSGINHMRKLERSSPWSKIAQDWEGLF